MSAFRKTAIVVIIFLSSLILAIGLISLLKGGQFLCRGKFMKPLSTGPGGGSFESSIQYLDLLNTKTCVVSVTEELDKFFPNASSTRLKIGFFDRFGRLYVYPARMGGTDFDGQQKEVGVCFPLDGEQKSGICKIINPSEALKTVKPGQIIDAQVIFKDAAPWLAAAQNDKYRQFFERLKSALQSGKDFPRPPEDEQFAIHIWQIGSNPINQ